MIKKYNKAVFVLLISAVLIATNVFLHFDYSYSASTVKRLKVSIDIFHHKTLSRGKYKKYSDWKSSKPKTVSVSKRGKVYSKRVGSATITAKKGNKKVKWTVKVTNNRGSYLARKYSADIGWNLLDESREFYLETKKLRLKKYEITSIGVHIYGLPKERDTYVYMDRKLDSIDALWGMDSFLEVSDYKMKLGTHTVTVVQYKDNDPKKEPLIYLSRSFKVVRF